jgi:hypothetical protein
VTPRRLGLWPLFALAPSLYAQPASSEFKAASGTVDLAVPESPAFVALGLTPQEVSRPTSARDLAASLLNGVDREGKLQTGVTIDTAPYMLAAGSKLTLREYQQGPYITRFLARWQTSFATVRASDSDDGSVRMALGMRFTLFDRGDPRTDTELLGCLAREAEAVLAAAPAVPPGTDLDIVNRQREEEVRGRVQPCREAAAARRWNRSAWIAGVAPTWTSPDGTAGNLGYSGTALWTSVGYGFEGVPVLMDHAMVAGYVKTRDQEIAPDRFQEGQFVAQDTLTLGARLLFGAPSTQVNLEGVWVRNDRPDDLEDKYWRVGLGLERKLVDHVWLAVAFGRELSRRESDDALFVLGSFKWGLGDKR